ncbi:MAG: hypothetical protein GF381_03275 [Candidatus Pacebacteria bacterium]|nr:hypothetical protein [Candidatus Paceibacterota bacterium]
MNLLITGGHLTPALALIDYLQADQTQVKLFFVGREYSQKKLQQKAVERFEVERRGVEFIPFDSVTTDLRRLSDLVVKPVGFFFSLFQALKIIRKTNPDVLVSFGGYLAVPLAIAAKLKGVKIVTHEQTRVAGQATRLIARLADRVAVSFSETKAFLPNHKTVVTGNPIRPELFSKDPECPVWFNSDSNLPLLLVMGGNQGALAINQIVKQLLPQLLEKYQLIHVCGRPNRDYDFPALLSQVASRVSPQKQDRYFIKEWISGHELAWIYQQPLRAVSRAGANSILELAMFQVPTVFIPLPKANYQEQEQNAAWLAQKQAAIVLEQDQLTPGSLIRTLETLEKNYYQLKDNLSQLRLPVNAAAKLYQLIEDLSVEK